MGVLDAYTYYDNHNYGLNQKIDDYIEDNYKPQRLPPAAPAAASPSCPPAVRATFYALALHGWLSHHLLDGFA